jgi:hypothetical protein
LHAQCTPAAYPFWALTAGSSACPVYLQYRYRLKGLDAEVSTVWGRPAPTVGVAKHFKYSTLRARYDIAGQEAALSYNHR